MSADVASIRKVGLIGATALVVANMIGTGIFTSTGYQIADMPSRSIILLAWLVGGGMALLGALCYGALARQLPESGGEYFFLSKTIHPSVGYISGWISLLVGFSAPIAAAAYGTGVYCQEWLQGVDPKWIGTVAVLLLGILHGIGVREGVMVQNLVVVFKIVMLIGFIGWSLLHLPSPEQVPAWDPDWGTFSVSLVWIYFAYSGWNAAVYIGGEVRDPDRNLPRAMTFGTIIVVVLYLALNGVFLWSGSFESMAGREDVARVAAESIGGQGLAQWVTLIILVSLMTSISAMLMAGPRVYAKMAEDGYLPCWMKSAQPPGWGNISLQIFVALLLLWIPTFKDLLAYIGFTLGIGTALTVLGLVKLKMKVHPNLNVPGWPVVPLLFLVMVLWVTVFSIWRQPVPSLYGVLTLLIGWVAWWFHRRGETGAH